MKQVLAEKKTRYAAQQTAGSSNEQETGVFRYYLQNGKSMVEIKRRCRTSIVKQGAAKRDLLVPGPDTPCTFPYDSHAR